MLIIIIIIIIIIISIIIIKRVLKTVPVYVLKFSIKNSNCKELNEVNLLSANWTTNILLWDKSWLTHQSSLFIYQFSISF